MYFILHVFLLIVYFLFKPDRVSLLDKEKLRVYLFFLLVSFLLHLFREKQKNWFRLDIIFLLGFIIVHFQWVIMISISNIMPDYISFSFIKTKYINYSTWLSLIGLQSWFIGYSALNYRKTKTKFFTFNIKYKKLFIFTIILFILFILNAGRAYFTGAVYKGESISASGAGFSVYIQFLLSVSVLLLVIVVLLNNGSTDVRKNSFWKWLLKIDKFFLLFITVYVLLFLFVGDRGAGIYVVLTFLFFFSILVKPISLKEFAFIIIISSLILTYIGRGRSETIGADMILAGAEKTKVSSIYDFTLELSNSVRTLYTSIEHVPKKHDYFYGKLWMGSMLSMIPFAQRVYLNISNDKAYELSSETYITYLRFGLKPKSGEGTSFIADIYLNFGPLGVLFFMLLFGIIFRKIQYELELQTNIYWIIASGMFSTVTFYMSRSSIFASLRLIVWGFILLALFVKIGVINEKK